MNLWGIALSVGVAALGFLTLFAGFVVYVAAKVAAHLVSEEVEGRIDQLGYGLVRLACLRLPTVLRDEYYQWWQADLAEHFQRHRERPITRLCWAARFSIPLLFTGRKTARILSAEAFTAPTRHRGRSWKSVTDRIKAAARPIGTADAFAIAFAVVGVIAGSLLGSSLGVVGLGVGLGVAVVGVGGVVGARLGLLERPGKTSRRSPEGR